MDIEEFKSELKLNMNAGRELARDPEVTVRQLAAHLRDNLWPFIESMVGEIESQADILDEVVEETGDILQPEAAGVFAALIVAAKEWAVPIIKATIRNPDDQAKLAAFEAMIIESSNLLEQITVSEEDDGEEDDEEDDEEEEDDEDDDDGGK